MVGTPGGHQEVNILCREFTLVKSFEGGLYATPLCCRSWSCDYCRPERKARVAYMARLGHPDTFITLTTNPARGGTEATRAAELVIAWREFVSYAKKLYGYASIPYFAVFEATKAGQPHLHILCRVKWIDQATLSGWMRRRIGAPIVDIRRCTSDRAAARYVSKYVGKAPGKFGTCKRYWQTRNYAGLTDRERATNSFKGGHWQRLQQHIDSLLLHHVTQGHRVQKVGPIWVIATSAPPAREGGKQDEHRHHRAADVPRGEAEQPSAELPAGRG